MPNGHLGITSELNSAGKRYLRLMWRKGDANYNSHQTRGIKQYQDSYNNKNIRTLSLMPKLGKKQPYPEQDQNRK